MPFAITWDSPDKTVICATFTGAWTVGEYVSAASQISEMLATVPEHPVDVILYAQNMSARPGSLLSSIPSIEQVVQSNQRLVVFVGVDQFIRTIINIGKRFTPRAGKNIAFAKSLTEARLLIKQRTANVV